MGSEKRKRAEDPVAEEVLKKAKKEKKDKKKEKASASASKAETDVESDAEMVDSGSAPLKTILVPFASPLANDKLHKKVMKGTKKAAKAKALKRGVKEVVKAIKKSDSKAGGATAVVVFAADIWPMDVISHMPVLCEENHIPYIFVTSRAELGKASGTKRPTSVVMVCKAKAGKPGKAEDEAEWPETYGDLLKAVEKVSPAV